MHRWLLSALALPLLLAACAGSPPGGDDSLYQALGGRHGISEIVDETLRNIADDTRIVRMFSNTDIERLRNKLIELICDISGGPCTYTGRPMGPAHAGLHINAAEFNAYVEDLQSAMETLNVPLSARNRLLALLAPMRDEIIHPAP